jgi:ADP-dependent glucokinase
MAAKLGHLVPFFGILIVSVLIGFQYNPKPSHQPAEVFHALVSLQAKRAEQSKADPAALSVALGYNVCIDAILRWHAVIGEQDVALLSARDVDVVNSVQDLHNGFAFYFGQGAAAERTCDPAVFQQLVAKADAAPDVRRSLGGNAALMARQLSKIGVTQLLIGGHVGPVAAALLPAGATFAGRVAAADEVHLILEYAKGERFHAASAPRANRFILTSDQANLDAGALIQTIRQADAAGSTDVLVIAGLHMMEPLSSEVRVQRIGEIAAALKARTSPFSVHLELASSADPAYMRAIVAALFPLVDSVGFNEQEGAFLYEALGGAFRSGSGRSAADAQSEIGSPADITGHAPNAAAVAALLRGILERYPALSRLHFHSLGFHVIAYSGASAAPAATRTSEEAVSAGANTVRRWRANVAGVAAGALTATREACRVETVTNELVHFVAPLELGIRDPRLPAADSAEPAAAAKPASGSAITTASRYLLSSHHPAAEWTWNSTLGPVRFVLAPVAVCNAPVSTVGLGDAISAAGLAYDALTAVEVERALQTAEAADAEALESTWPVLRLVRRWRERAQLLVAKARAAWEEGV